MKISSATLLVVLVCLLGAIATSFQIVTQYQMVQKVQGTTERTRLAGRDLQQLKTMMSQWYVSIDLFFENGDSYVASGVIKQASAMQTLWLSLPRERESAAEVDGARYIIDAATKVEKLALTGPAEATSWNKGLAEVDDLTSGFVELFEKAIQSNAADLIFQSELLAEEQDRLVTDAWGSAAVYLISIFLAWIWANRQIVQPIASLYQATRKSGEDSEKNAGADFELSRGPFEIQRLSKALSAYVEELASKNRTISAQKEQIELRLAELERTRSALVKAEKLASVGQLAAGIAHEINNPVSFVTSNLNSLGKYIEDIEKCLVAQHRYVDQRAKVKEADPDAIETNALWNTLDMEFVLEDCTDVLADIKEGTQRVTRIVSELSEFTDQSHALEEVDLNALVQKTVEKLGDTNLPPIPLELNLQATRPIHCAPERLENALVAIITNAIEASVEQETSVQITTGDTDEATWIEVADAGSGIPEQDQLKIFDPFYTTKPIGASLGLSLHFVQSIVDQHDGSIECQSAPSHGTKMTLELPRSQAA